jgi:2'-5' RNA ligase
MRLFIAVDIEAEIRERIARFVEGVQNFAPEARWVSGESFHLTLKFIGEQPPAKLDRIRQALGAVRASPAAVRFRGTGFFPCPRSARVFWVGIEAEANLATLAGKVDKALAELDIAPETRAFSPHLTLARGGDPRRPRGGSGRPQAVLGDRPNQVFGRLQEKLASLPPVEFGSMTASDFFLYESKLSPAGAKYTRLDQYVLRA